jgi:hypothetical protein
MVGKEVRRDGHDDVQKPIPFAVKQTMIVTLTNKTARHILQEMPGRQFLLTRELT